MKNHENVPAIIQPKTTRTTAVTTIMEGFFFSIQQAKSKLDKGRSLLKTLYLKIWALSILFSLSCNDPACRYLCISFASKELGDRFSCNWQNKTIKVQGVRRAGAHSDLKRLWPQTKLEILNSKFCLQYWTLGVPENRQLPMLEDFFFLQPTSKYLATCRKKPTGLMLGPLRTKNYLCSRKISFFRQPKPQIVPHFCQG